MKDKWKVQITQKQSKSTEAHLGPIKIYNELNLL